MNKKYPILWTENASTTYINTIFLIFEKWTIKEVEHFESLVEDLQIRLSNNTNLCPKSKLTNVRKCVVSTQTSLIYRIKSKSIELLAFIDNRSNHSY